MHTVNTCYIYMKHLYIYVRIGLAELEPGVYIGWASVAPSDNSNSSTSSSSNNKSSVYKAVVNVGYSPTFADQNSEKIIEAHLLNYSSSDFYEQPMRLLLCGFLRPEKKFASFPQLVAAINKDLRDATTALDTEPYASARSDQFFTQEQAPPVWRRGTV
jgi:riboflavin kinase